MKLILAHREVSLTSELDYQERKMFIENLLSEPTGLKDNEDDDLTIEQYFRYTWEKQNTRTAMDIISYYLTKGNSDFEGEDKEVLSHRKEKELKKGSKRHVTFSAMSVKHQEDLGLIDISEAGFS